MVRSNKQKITYKHKTLKILLLTPRLQKSTLVPLQKLKDKVLSRVLKQMLDKDPAAPVLTDEHYVAMDRRLRHILDEVERCIEKHGIKNVLVKKTRSTLPQKFWI